MVGVVFVFVFVADADADADAGAGADADGGDWRYFRTIGSLYCVRYR